MNTTHRQPATRLKPLVAALAATLVSTLAFATPPATNALPTGGQVIAGGATISQSGSQMTIDQTTGKAILSWDRFDIGSGAGVTFHQPGADSVALNRVRSSDPSAIYGSFSANGQVFLINPSGVIFGQGAKVDVGGLVASTLDIADNDFLAGRYRFNRDGATGSVVSEGEINAHYVALLAPEVRNDGVITATMGTVALAAGEAVTLDITGHDLVDIQVTKAAIDTLVENHHLIQADGGQVILSAQSANGLLGSVVNTGQVQANGITSDGGTIRLTASSNIETTGTLRADGGTHGKGGTIQVIADLANPDSRTTVGGTLSAQGGTQSGDGGFIETSATHLKINDDAYVTTLAAHGGSGEWLLDPNDFTVAATGGDMTGAALSAALTHGTVTIQTTSGNASCTQWDGSCGIGHAGNGDIFILDNVTIPDMQYLRLIAYRNININAAITAQGSGMLTLRYGWEGTNTGSKVREGYVNWGPNASFGGGGSIYDYVTNGSVSYTSGLDCGAGGTGCSSIFAAPPIKWDPAVVWYFAALNWENVKQEAKRASIAACEEVNPGSARLA